MALESKLQKKVIAALKRKGFYVNKIMLCSNNGHPDIEAFRIFPGSIFTQLVLIECKSKGKKAEPLQKYRHAEIRKHGGSVFTIDTFEKFKALEL